MSDAGGTLVYTSNAGYTGPDQFTYSAADDHGGTSAPTTMFVTVVAVQRRRAARCAAAITLRPERSRCRSISPARTRSTTRSRT